MMVFILSYKFEQILPEKQNQTQAHNSPYFPLFVCDPEQIYHLGQKCHTMHASEFRGIQLFSL